MKVIVQRDFSFNSPTYCEVCFGSTECTQRWRWYPRTARFASACPAHITVVVDQEGLLLTQCGVDPPADREAGDTKQTVFIGELLMIDFLFLILNFICRNLDQESDVSADF